MKNLRIIFDKIYYLVKRVFLISIMISLVLAFKSVYANPTMDYLYSINDKDGVSYFAWFFKDYLSSFLHEFGDCIFFIFFFSLIVISALYLSLYLYKWRKNRKAINK